MQLQTSPHAARTMPGFGSKQPATATQRPIPQLPGVEQKFIDVGGVKYHYAEAGQGEPLVLVHGFPENWYMWRDLIPELSKHYRVIAPDMRGAGWTDAPKGGYGKEQLADELAGFMDAVGAPRAKVMAHDWGGFVSFMLALRHPERVEKYLAMNITTPWPAPRQALDAWRLLYQPIVGAPLIGPRLMQSDALVGGLMRKMTAPGVEAWTDDELKVFTSQYDERARADAGSELYRTFVGREALPLLTGKYDDHRLDIPTLLLTGEHDPVVKPGLLGDWKSHTSNMSVEVVPDAGHFLPEERPDFVVDRALEFFAD